MTLRRIILLRHGQTDYNVEGRMQGHLDSHLTTAGHDQAAAAAPMLAELAPDRIVSSDLRRAVDTLDELNRHAAGDDAVSTIPEVAS